MSAVMDTPVSGTPRLWLRLEGVCVLVAAVTTYHALGASWWMFGALLLVPDVSMLAYVFGPRVGAAGYNALHAYVGPAVLAAYAYGTGMEAAWPICLIWLAHIGMDRALGFGLKFATAFGHTHLGTVGRA